MRDAYCVKKLIRNTIYDIRDTRYEIMTGGLRKILFFVLLLCLAYIAYQYMIKPANSDLAAKRAKVESDRDKLARLAEFERNFVAGDVNGQIEKLQKTMEFFERKLPSKSDIAEVLEQVTVIAQKQGLKPKTIRTLKEKDNNGYIEQPLKMELVGDFNSFYSFLLELEKLPRIMKVRELELKKQPKDEGQVAANFVVSIFFQNKLSS